MDTESDLPLVIHSSMTEDEFYAWADEDCPYQYLGGDLVREPVSRGHEVLFAFLLNAAAAR
jgi:hypothetical protein